jgi:hypothetical protein
MLSDGLIPGMRVARKREPLARWSARSRNWHCHHLHELPQPEFPRPSGTGGFPLQGKPIIATLLVVFPLLLCAVARAESGYHVAGLRADSVGAVAFDISADYVTLFNPTQATTQTVMNVKPLRAAINKGPSPGYRDSATPFPPGATVWFYFIGGRGVPVSVISSLRPPVAGPVLPIPYTAYAPAFPVVLTSKAKLPAATFAKPPADFKDGQIFAPMRVRGNRAYYLEVPDTIGCTYAPPTPRPCTVDVPQSVDVSGYLPVGSLEAIVEVDAEVSSSTEVVISGLVLHAAKNANFANLSVYVQAPHAPGGQNAVFFIPLAEGDFNLRWTWMCITHNGTRYMTYFFIQGYTFANGS